MYKIDPIFSNRDVTGVDSLLRYSSWDLLKRQEEREHGLGFLIFEARHIPKGGGFVPSIWAE